MRGIVTPDMFECIPEIDFNVGYRYFLGNMENYKQALLSTLKSTKAKLPILQSMLQSEEFEGLRTITQTLRRMCGNIGANVIAELSYQLEVTILNEHNTRLKDELGDYIGSLTEFSEHLEQLLKNMDISNTVKYEEEQVSFGNYDFTKTKESIKLSTNLLDRKII
ncbi:MAG TPA: hypothetical protein VN131_03095 [Mobilitalea sp.]|nr:hypothetical protein [Mobilitalea sp.]